MIWPDRIVGALFLVLLSTTLAFGLYPVTSPNVALGQIYTPSFERTVELEQAFQLWRGGDAIFIDAREKERFDAGHIEGAWHLPLARTQISGELKLRLQDAAQLIVYCDGPECGAAKRLAQRLVAADLQQVAVLEAGYRAWLEAGFPSR